MIKTLMTYEETKSRDHSSENYFSRKRNPWLTKCKYLRYESKSYLKMVEYLTKGKNIDTPWQTWTSKSDKSNITTKSRKNTNINSLPLLNSYEVLRIDDKDYIENENDDTIKRV